MFQWDIPRKRQDKDWQKLRRLATAYESEYNRLVASNDKLKAEAAAFRKSHNITLESPGEYVHLVDREIDKFEERIRRGENLCGRFKIPLDELVDAEVDRLARKYGAENWKKQIRSLIMFGRPIMVSFSMGFPGMKFEYNKNQKVRCKIIIPPDFDPTNSFHQKWLENMRIKYEDPIPAPQPMKGNRRKLDWRPVWEWESRHPSITRAQIARLLRRNPVTVRRKLAEIDAELGK